MLTVRRHVNGRDENFKTDPRFVQIIINNRFIIKCLYFKDYNKNVRT